MTKLLGNHSKSGERGSRSLAVRESSPVSNPEPARSGTPDKYSDAIRLWPHAPRERVSGYIPAPERPVREYRPDIQTVVLEPRERRVEPAPSVTADAPPPLLTDKSSRNVSNYNDGTPGVVEKCFESVSRVDLGAELRALSFLIGLGGAILLLYLVGALIIGIATGGPSASRQRFQDQYGYDRDTGRPVRSEYREYRGGDGRYSGYRDD